MAFTFRASSTSDDNSGTGITVNKPTGTTEGDIMFALVGFTGYSVNKVPSGWTLVGQGYSNSYLYYKIATSSEPNSYYWGLKYSGRIKATIGTYYGDYNISNPIGVVSNTEYTTTNNILRASSMNVTVSNSPLLFLGLVYSTSAATFTKPSVPTTDWVEDIDTGSTGSDSWHTFCHMIWTSSGETGNIDATISTSMEPKHAFAISLNLPVSGPANLKSYNTNLKANIKTINTNPIANVKSLNTNL